MEDYTKTAVKVKLFHYILLNSWKFDCYLVCSELQKQKSGEIEKE